MDYPFFFPDILKPSGAVLRHNPVKVHQVFLKLAITSSSLKSRPFSNISPFPVFSQFSFTPYVKQIILIVRSWIIRVLRSRAPAKDVLILRSLADFVLSLTFWIRAVVFDCCGWR
jgi:hypothetical protein